MFGSERLTGALLDRLTHHVHILEMNGDSYRLAHSKRRVRRSKPDISSRLMQYCSGPPMQNHSGVDTCLNILQNLMLMPSLPTWLPCASMH